MSRPRVLVVSRAYPSAAFPALGLWVERPTELLAADYDVHVLNPVQYCPPFPRIGRLRHYTRFRDVPRRDVRGSVTVLRPRFLAGPGLSLYRHEGRLGYLASRRAVDRLRRAFPFDLVHAHFVYPEGEIAARLSERYGVPLVVTEHAPWTAARLRPESVRRAALMAAARAHALLAVSTSVRDSIVSFTGAPERIHVVPVGVDPQRFAPVADEQRRNDQLFYAGWLNYNKGIDVLLRAMAILRERESPLELVLAGGSYYRNQRIQERALRALADELGLHDRVTFLGQIPHAEVARRMAESAAVVLPSHAESFGAVLVEALASGTPVVATRCGGPEDIVTDEVGELVEPGDPVALADALAAVAGSRQRFPAHALRRYALSRFAWDGIAQRVRAVYDEAIGREPRAADRERRPATATAR